jgi:hypothetical protein
MGVDKRDRREYKKQYYEKNRERFLEARKIYYENNKELVKETNKEYEKHYIQTAKGKYSIQKRKAKRRGIAWELSFEEWWTIWEASGKWSERGWGKDKYVMCRYGDIGAYSIDNVFIDTNSNNTKSMNLSRDTGGRFLPKNEDYI